MSFVKLDTGILQSTLWLNRPQREVFITALLMAEPRQFLQPQEQLKVREIVKTGFVVPPGWYGFVAAAGSGIVRAAVMPMAEGLDALEQLGEPDNESRSSDYEGRRLIRIDGGYLLLNYMKYREYDHGAAERMRALRQRRKTEVPENNQLDLSVTRTPEPLRRTVTDADADADAKKSKEAGASRLCTFDDFIDNCKTLDQKPLPPTDPVFRYAEKIKLPIEHLRICWREFSDRHSGQPSKYKGVKGWRQAFGNCVRANWYKLWFRDERGDWSLTTAGHQANRAHAEPRPPAETQAGART